MPTPRKPPEEHKPRGKPSTYNPDIAKQMCQQLADGIPLREICRQEGYPAWQTVYDWMYRDAELSKAIARAREIGYDAIAEDCLRIADTPCFGEEMTESEDENGVKRVSIKKIDMLGHRKLQVETRLKLLAKFNPKKYGDRTTLAGDEENPVVIQANTAVFKELLTNLKLRRQSGE